MYIYIFSGKFVYMAHHFILLRLNPFDLRFDREGWWFEHSVSYLWPCLSAEDAKNVFDPGYLCSKDGVVWPWYLLVNLYIYIYIYINFQLCYSLFFVLGINSCTLYLMIAEAWNFKLHNNNLNCFLPWINYKTVPRIEHSGIVLEN